MQGGGIFVMNGQGERLPVYISDKGGVPKDGTSSLEDTTRIRFIVCAVPGAGLRNVW